MEIIPDISIIVPVFNRPRLIKECIQSVIDQTHENWELLVVDDGSNDETVEVVESFSKTDKRIKLIERKQLPKGAQHCRNIGIKNAVGEYIIFLDSDDLLAPFCLRQRLLEMKHADKLDFLVFPQMVFNDKPGDSPLLINIATSEPALNRFFTLVHCLDVPWITTGPIFKRSSIINKTLEWNISTKGFQDVEFNVSAIVAGLSFEYAAKPADNYHRVHSESRIGDAIYSLGTTASSEKMLLRLFQRIEKGGLLTEELKLRISKSFFYVVVEKLVLANKRADAFNALKKMKQVRMISKILYFQIRFYIFFNAPYFKSFNNLRNKIIYRFWRNSIYKRTDENYLKHSHLSQ